MSSKTFNNTKINVEFDEDYQSRTNINSGENISSLFAKIRRFILDLKSVAFSGSYNDLSDVPDVVTKEYVDSKVAFYDGIVSRSTNTDTTNCWVKIAECEAPNNTAQIMDEITLYPCTTDSSVKTTCKVRVEGKGAYASTWKLHIIDSTKDFNSNKVKLIYDKNIVDEKRKIELWGYNINGWDGFYSQKTFGNNRTLTHGLKCLTSQNKFATTYLHDNFAEAPTIDISIKSLVNEGLTSLENDIALNRTTLGTQCKNLLKNNAVTKTVNGVTFTVNSDGSVTVKQTTTAPGNATIDVATNITLNPGTYILTGDDEIKKSGYGEIRFYINGTIYAANTAHTFDEEVTISAVRIFVWKGVNINGSKTIYPMLRYADITDDTYEPYKESVDERLIQNKSDIAVNKSTLGYQRKNILDETGYLSSITSVTRGTKSISGNQITLTATADNCFTNPHTSSDGGYRIPVEPDTDYILSWESDNTYAGLVYVFMNGNTSNYKNANNKVSKYIKFTTNSDTTFITIRLAVATSGNSITYSNIMLRYADILDDTYEPYQPSVQEQIIGTYFPMTQVKGIADNTDLNTITEIGNYVCYSGGSAVTMINCPTKAGGFRLIVTNLIVSSNDNSTIRYQWIIPNNLNNVLCFRRKIDISTDTFSSWYSFGGTVVS